MFYCFSRRVSLFICHCVYCTDERRKKVESDAPQARWQTQMCSANQCIILTTCFENKISHIASLQLFASLIKYLNYLAMSVFFHHKHTIKNDHTSTLFSSKPTNTVKCRKLFPFRSYKISKLFSWEKLFWYISWKYFIIFCSRHFPQFEFLSVWYFQGEKILMKNIKDNIFSDKFGKKTWTLHFPYKKYFFKLIFEMSDWQAKKGRLF